MKKRIVNILLIIVLFISMYKIIGRIIEYKKADNIYNKLIEVKNNNIKYVYNVDNNKDIHNILDLSYINEDYQGWIHISNTNVDYPILQSTDNLYYLNKDINNEYLLAGSIFLDFRNNNFSDLNTVIYGHNMKDNTMFGDLDKFIDSNFAKENIININTKSGEVLKYQVFSVYITDDNDDYINTKFNSQAEYEVFINQIQKKSIIENNIDVTSLNKIITLSTCNNAFYNARTVIHAKLLTDELS